MKKDKKDTTDKAKEFMANNWWILWVAIGLSSILNFITTNNVSDKYDKALEKIDKASKGVVMLDYSGRAIYNDKKIVDATNPGFKAAVLNALRFYSIKDWQTLSKNFTVKIKTIDDLEANNPDFVEFKENYLTDDESAAADYASFQKTLLYLVNTDNLPEKIVATGSRINTYSVDNNSFDIFVQIDVYQSIYMVESDKEVSRTGSVEIRASGVFDPEKGTPVNPLGIRFNTFKPSFLKKR